MSTRHAWGRALQRIELNMASGLLLPLEMRWVRSLNISPRIFQRGAWGAFGIGLILIGFSLQSFQYWIVVLDVPVR